MMKEFYPMIRENGRIVNVSSIRATDAQLGFDPIYGNSVCEILHSRNIWLELSNLENLAHQFINDCKEGKNEKIGWPKSAYATSKLFVNGITRVYSWVKKQLFISITYMNFTKFCFSGWTGLMPWLDFLYLRLRNFLHWFDFKQYFGFSGIRIFFEVLDLVVMAHY